MIGNLVSIPLGGLQQASARLEASAERLARQGGTPPSVAGTLAPSASPPSAGSGTRLGDRDEPEIYLPEDGAGNPAEEAVQQQIAVYDFRANAKVLQAADRMTTSLLDITA